MKNVIMILLGILFLAPLQSQAFTTAGCGGDCMQCHKLDKKDANAVLKKLKKAKNIPPEAKLLDVKLSPVGGLWQLDVEVGKKRGRIYMDFAKKHLIFGQVVSVDVIGRSPKPQKVDFKKIPLKETLVMGSKKAKNKIKRRIKSVTGDPLYEDMKKTWNEILHLRAGETDVEKLNRTYLYEKTLLKQMLKRTKGKVLKVFGFRNPKVRVILDDRADFMEKEFLKFDYMINPYHIQPGLILDIDITSIKRKKFTLSGMANVLNEFLHGVSKGFQDAAFASFSRRRSTVREDITQSFATGAEEEITAHVPDHVPYSASLMEEAQAERGGGAASARVHVKGKTNVTPRKKKSGLDDLKEL